VNYLSRQYHRGRRRLGRSFDRQLARLTGRVDPRQLTGVHYQDFLVRLHQILQPRGYLEIGVFEGATLALACCDAVAIDPSFAPSGKFVPGRRASHLFQTTSDQFFSDYDLRHFLPAGLDLAFLDGMHLFEYLLRDIMNTERFSHRATVLVLHDCIPSNVQMAARENRPETRTDRATSNWWTGDVWKALPILREFRTDLRITVFDCPPTGLVLLTGLDPGSHVLQDNYPQIVDRFGRLQLEEYGLDRLRNDFEWRDSRLILGADALPALLDGQR
jgi:hypothetical protein